MKAERIWAAMSPMAPGAWGMKMVEFLQAGDMRVGGKGRMNGLAMLRAADKPLTPPEHARARSKRGSAWDAGLQTGRQALAATEDGGAGHPSVTQPSVTLLSVTLEATKLEHRPYPMCHQAAGVGRTHSM